MTASFDLHDFRHHRAVDMARLAAPHFATVADALAFDPAPGDDVYHRVADTIIAADATGGHYVLHRADGSSVRVIASGYADIDAILTGAQGSQLSAA